MNSKVSIIVAMDEDRGIGFQNKLLFKIPEDFKRMREKINGHSLIMGRKTFESLGRLLPNKVHIVITHNPQLLQHLSYQPHEVVSSIKDGIEVAKKYPGADEIFIFGGGQVFDEALKQHLIDCMYLTIVKGKHKYDTFFPAYEKYGFKEIERKDRNADGFEYTFLTLVK